MKPDELIRKRFLELDQKAEALLKNHVFDFQADDGTTYYKVPSAAFVAWGTSAINLLGRGIGESSIHYKNFLEHYEKFGGYEHTLEECRAILNAALEDFEGGYLFNLRALVQAELLDGALEQAVELLKSGYKDPAVVLAGAALELALKEMCSNAGIPPGKLDKMNVELCKTGKFNLSKQKQITAWADLRNKAAHADFNGYNEADAKDLLEGVNRFIADYL